MLNLKIFAFLILEVEFKMVSSILLIIVQSQGCVLVEPNGPWHPTFALG